MRHNETEILIKKYLNVETTAEEERQLALEVSHEDAPEDWKIIAEMLGELTIDEALFDQMMTECRQKPRIIKLWPWLAAACVAALLIIFLGPPRENVSTQPQIANIPIEQKQVRPKFKVAEVKPVEPKAEKPQTIEKPLQTHKARLKKVVSKGIIKEGKKTVIETYTLRPVEEGDIVPYEDPMMQFAEQARALRERGNRVIQRVSMNFSHALNNTSITPDNYPFNDL